MKTLINSIELISFSYMNSNNNTLNKFGIEYSHIATAMNNMLGFVNKDIKNMEINGTNAIAIDYSFMCIYLIAITIGSAIGMAVSIASAIASFGTVTPAAAWGFFITLNFFGLGIAGVATSC